MRKYLIPLLMATALTPAMAHARPDRSESDSDSRSERSVQRAERQAADRPARTERNANVDRSSRAEPAPRTERTVGVDRTNRAEHGQRADRPARADRVQPADRDVQPVQEAESPQPVQNSQINESGRGGLAGAFTQIGHDMIDGRTHDGDDDHDDHDDHDGHDGHHDGDHHDGDHHDGDHHWNHDWRHDHRYDWSSYRNRYRSLFHLGSYYDPYGWGYRRWSVGYSLWPSYYGSNYWLDDPWSYRLPPAYGPYRWVRYYDDAVLVNTYTGEVVDVVYNFFW